METDLQNPSSQEETTETQAKPRFQIGRLLAWGGLLLLLGIVGMQLAKVQKGPVSIGEPVPEFVLTTFDGEEISTAGLKGKVVLINFWASWCKPCEQEAADLERAWQMYQPTGQVVFLGVDWTDTEQNALEYLDRFGITYPNGPDLGTRISQQYRISGVPETFIVDQSGNLVHFKKGPFTALNQITGVIDPLLEGQ